MQCQKCGNEVPQADIYCIKDKSYCDKCAMQVGLFPLGHTGARRDGISEEGRQLCHRKPEEY